MTRCLADNFYCMTPGNPDPFDRPFFRQAVLSLHPAPGEEEDLQRHLQPMCLSHVPTMTIALFMATVGHIAMHDIFVKPHCSESASTG